MRGKKTLFPFFPLPPCRTHGLSEHKGINFTFTEEQEMYLLQMMLLQVDELCSDLASKVCYVQLSNNWDQVGYDISNKFCFNFHDILIEQVYGLLNTHANRKP